LKDKNNQTIAFHGLNFILGYNFRAYLKPVEAGWNGYIQAGTMMVFSPYGQAGLEYVSDSNVCFNIGFGAILVQGVNFFINIGIGLIY